LTAYYELRAFCYAPVSGCAGCASGLSPVSANHWRGVSVHSSLLDAEVSMKNPPHDSEWSNFAGRVGPICYVCPVIPSEGGLAFVSTAWVISPTTFARQGTGVDVNCGKWRWFLLTAHWGHKEEHEREQHSRSFIPQRYQWVDTHGASRWHPAGEKTDQQEQHNNREERQRIVGRNSPELVGQYSGDRQACG
jgi:hypothetical protein